MFRIQSRIFRKGLVLLCVPLMFEVIVATTLVFLQHYYGEAVKAEALRNEIVYHLGQLWNHTLTLTTKRFGRAFIRGFASDGLTGNRIAERGALLKELLANDPQQLERLQQVMDSSNYIRQLSLRLKATFSNSAGPMGQISWLKRNVKTCRRLTAANMEAGDLIRSFREEEQLQSTKANEKVRFFAAFIQLALAGVIIGSTIIAFLLFRYFMRGINFSLQTLTQNIERFKRAEPLNPAIKGTDEIALLDVRFHEMANEVAAAQRMKQAFITTISSELKAPICSTREYLKQFSGGSFGVLPAGAVEEAKKAEKFLDRLIGLLNDLLSLQAPGISRMEILPRMCSMEEVIQTSIDAVSPLADKNGIRLQGPDASTAAYADPDRIVQVLVNLLSNAIKFSPSGSTIVVASLPVGYQVEIRVTDRGRGIPSHMRDAVFQRFQQVTVTDATEKGGTGLGLPICKEIIERHGGSIGVESEEGQGSTFWFRLPVHSAAAVHTVPDVASQPVQQPKSKSRKLTLRTIYAKGLILISVPLMMELALGITMFSLQRYYQERLDRERVEVQTLFHANEMWINCAEFMILKGSYVLFGGPEPPIDAIVKRFHDESALVQKLVAADPAQLLQFETVHSCLLRALNLSNQVRPIASTDLPVWEKRMVLFADLRAMSEAYGLIHSIQNDIKLFGSASRKAGERETLDSLLEQEIRSRRRFGNRRSSGGGPIESLKTETAGAVQFLARTAGITEVEKATALADKVVLGSLAASTLIAIMLFAYFMRSINTGVNVVVENTDRFKRGEELKPPVENGDELAQVDAALYEMAQEIREAERTKQTIVATIAHDLRTPLTTVLGYFTLLASGALGDVPPAAISVAEKCERDVEELIRLINDLLDLEKIEAGKLSLRPKMLPVKQVIARAISNVLPFAEEKGVIVQGGDSSAEIYADPDRIVQALGNLLSSAVKLSPDGSLVDASAVPHNGEVEVRVTSSGVSTPGDLLNTQFDRYHQREHGLRLELPISKELIKLHGGTIGAISENNRCTFWCRLPSTMPTQQAA